MKRACVTRTVYALGGCAAGGGSDPTTGVSLPPRLSDVRRWCTTAAAAAAAVTTTTPRSAPTPAPPATPPAPPASLEQCLGADVRAAVNRILKLRPGDEGKHLRQVVARLDGKGWGRYVSATEGAAPQPVVTRTSVTTFYEAAVRAGVRQPLVAVWRAMPEHVRGTGWAVYAVLKQQEARNMTVAIEELLEGLSEEAARVALTPSIVSTIVESIRAPMPGAPWRLMHFEKVRGKLTQHLRAVGSAEVSEQMTWGYYAQIIRCMGAADEVVPLRNLLRRLFETEERVPDKWLTHLRPPTTKPYPQRLVDAVLRECRRTGQGVLIIRFVATLCRANQFSKFAPQIAQALDPETGAAEEAEAA
eukprot:Rhum_TRINITY_DN5502_c0_g1::Rhum_TRINITY_DN5502_c0_g1_i1::g.17626::m.17626